MSNNLSYYLKYINMNSTPQDNIQELSDSYSQQRSNAISPFLILINSNQAQDIKLNGIPMKSIINYRKIKEPMLNSLVRDIQLPSNVMKYGDYVEYKSTSKPEDITNSNTYLIKSKIEFHDDYDSAYMQVCNNFLKFKTIINNKEELLEIPAIIGNGILSLEENKYIDTQDNQITCEVGYSQINKIKYIKDTDAVTRFIINGKTWKVSGVDWITKIINGQGIYIIKLESDEKNSKDDFNLGIAYNELIPIQPIPISNLIISGSSKTPWECINTYKVTNSDNTSTNKTFTFSLQQSDKNPLIIPTSLISIQSYDNISCKLLGNKNKIKGYLNLKCICNEDNLIVLTKEIYVGSVI